MPTLVQDHGSSMSNTAEAPALRRNTQGRRQHARLGRARLREGRLVEIPLRGAGERGPVDGRTPSGAQAGLPGSRGHLGSDLNTWRLPNRKQPTLAPLRQIPTPGDQMARQRRRVVERPGRGARDQPRCLCVAQSSSWFCFPSSRGD